jgi:predicted DNA-binding transcriptional regulator YafY
MRRIERLINLVAALLETSRPMTADDIRHKIAGYDEAANFEAFRRMFERDKDSLRNIGIPLEVVSVDAFEDRREAYIIPKARYYLPDIDFEPDEVAALRIVAQSLVGGSEQAESGVLKLSMDDPEERWSGPRVRWGADLAAEQPALGPLYSAIIDRTPVAFRYRSARSDDVRRREIEPFGLLHRWGHWYLVGNDRGDGVVKSFKVARIDKGVQRIDGSYEVPADFNASDHLAGETFALGDETESATVRFDASMRWWVEQNMPDAPRRESSEGALDIDLPVANVDALISWLIGFGSSVELIWPDDARAKLLQHLEPHLQGAG